MDGDAFSGWGSVNLELWSRGVRLFVCGLGALCMAGRPVSHRSQMTSRILSAIQSRQGLASVWAAESGFTCPRERREMLQRDDETSSYPRKKKKNGVETRDSRAKTL